MAVMVVVLGSSANAEAARPGQRCVAPAAFPSFAPSLRRTARRLAHSEPLTVVAIGSSSTAGAGASSSAAAYPARLEAALKAHFPTISIRVLNRGVNGEEIPQMLARLDRDVVAEKPDLILWQLGTNAIMRDHDVSAEAPLLQEGLERLKSTGADIVLIDPQFAPKVIAKPEAEHMVELIAASAKLESVGLFNRFALMRDWHDVRGVPFDAFLAPDGLHLNDWSYDCVANLLATSIIDAATRVPMTAGAAPSVLGVPTIQQH